MTTPGREQTNAEQAVRDLFRPRCWEHTGVMAWSAVDGNEYANPPRRRPWLSRFTWPHTLYPWFGGDEWCRWTLVVPLIATSLVVPLWGCRNPDCEACQIDCTPAPARESS